MNAFYFGERIRRLFGFYHAGRPVAGAPRAVVLCNSWGPEYTHAHRTLRQAAIQLSAAGIHVLRFDYYGTGDSEGDLTDASVSIWHEDIRTAMQEIAAISGASRVGLIGFRFGGMLAARVAASDPAMLDRLLLWDPVVNGSAFLDELFYNCEHDPEAYRELRTRPTSAGGGYEVHGFPLTESMNEQIRALDLGTVSAGIPATCAILISGPERDLIQVRNRLAPPVDPGSIEHVPEMPCWTVQWPPQLRSLPAKFLRRLVERACEEK
jgi:pimeloyl-ACP methyl ester carboxylesterase